MAKKVKKSVAKKTVKKAVKKAAKKAAKKGNTPGKKGGKGNGGKAKPPAGPRAEPDEAPFSFDELRNLLKDATAHLSAIDPQTPKIQTLLDMVADLRVELGECQGGQAPPGVVSPA